MLCFTKGGIKILIFKSSVLLELKSFLAMKMITLALIHKAKKGDVNAYKALMDSAYGGVKQSLELTEAETPIFKQLDIDVID